MVGGSTVSHGTDADASNVSADPSLALTSSGALTAPPPVNASRVIAPGSTTSPGAASTTSETVRTPLTAPPAGAVSRPVWVPPARPAGSTVTVTPAGVVTDGTPAESHGASLVRFATVPGLPAESSTDAVRGPSPSAASRTSVAGSHTRAFEPFAVTKVAEATCLAPPVVVTRTVMVCSPSASVVVSSGSARWVTDPGPKSYGAVESVRTGAPPMSGSSSHHVVLVTSVVGASSG